MVIEESSDANQYLTFTLDGEVFGLAITQVREVLDYAKMTRVPQMPDFMRGVINLRGGVVPVVDMRCKFGMPPTEKTVNTCIIIVEVELEGAPTILGALTDSVCEVLELDRGQIEPAPRIGSKLRTDFIRGMGKHDERFIILLDIDRVFSFEELKQVQGLEVSSDNVANR